MEHTYGPACLLCPGRGGKPGPCDHYAYRQRLVSYLSVPWHMEEFETSGWTEHLAEEFRYVPFPKHGYCICRCPQKVACDFCVRRQKAMVGQLERAQIGRTAMVHPPLPTDPVLTDIKRAWAAGHRTPRAITRFLDGEMP